MNNENNNDLNETNTINNEMDQSENIVNESEVHKSYFTQNNVDNMENQNTEINNVVDTSITDIPSENKVNTETQSNFTMPFENVQTENIQENTINEKVIPEVNNQNNEVVNTEETIQEEVNMPVSSEPSQTEEKNGIAVAGFVISLLGFHIISLILSIIGLKRSKEKNGKGKGLSIAGIVISIIGMIFTLLILAAVAFFISYKGDNKTFSDLTSNVKKIAIVTEYASLQSQVEEKVSNNSNNIVCSNDCDDIYNYEDDNADFTVSDKGIYYELVFKPIGQYNNVDLNDVCEEIDIECSNNTIIGKVEK